MKIRVNLKSAGKCRKSVEPVVYQIKGCPRTVRELILAVTESSVEAYHRRMDSQDILGYLTKEQMEGQAQEGKVSFGNHYGGKKAVLPEAQEHALQCFEDGIYRIFMDGEPLEALDTEISVTEESGFTFVRLAMLVGRMW